MLKKTIKEAMDKRSIIHVYTGNVCFIGTPVRIGKNFVELHFLEEIAPFESCLKTIRISAITAVGHSHTEWNDVRSVVELQTKDLPH